MFDNPKDGKKHYWFSEKAMLEYIEANNLTIEYRVIMWGLFVGDILEDLEKRDYVVVHDEGRRGTEIGDILRRLQTEERSDGKTVYATDEEITKELEEFDR